MNPLKRLLPGGRSPHTICFGLYQGIRLLLDLRGGDLQTFAGLYERETFPFLRRSLPGCRGALDLGAARGELSLRFLREPGMESVVAVEPSATELAILQGNLAANQMNGDPRLHIHAGYAGPGEPQLWRTLDELAVALPGPVFLKIDIDGPEADVLATGHELLSTHDCRVLIETHSPEAETACLRQLVELGYTTQVIRPGWWRALLPEHRPIPHNRWLAAWRPSSV
jgi:hypothetical protein